MENNTNNVVTSSNTNVSTANTAEGIELAAARQLQQLDLEGKLNGSKNPSGTKTRNGSSNVVQAGSSRSSSRTRKSSTSSQNQPQSPQSPDVKKLPMNKIVVGTVPSPEVSKVTSKIGSLANTSYKPSGGKVKIEHKKLEWKAQSKIGSLQNVKHQPGGGDVKIVTRKVEIKGSPRIGSLQNVKHQPGGGDKKIFDETKKSSRASSSASNEHPQ